MPCPPVTNEKAGISGGSPVILQWIAGRSPVEALFVFLTSREHVAAKTQDSHNSALSCVQSFSLSL